MADTKQALTASECMEKAGAQVVHGPTNECPAGYQTLGAVEDGSTTGLCCQRPESIDFQECADREGEAMLDPGSGQTYRDGCPENRQLLGWLDACTGSLCGEGGICCALVEED